MVYFATVTKLLFISTSLSSCFHCNENSREDFRTFSPNFFFSSLFLKCALLCVLSWVAETRVKYALLRDVTSFVRCFPFYFYFRLITSATMMKWARWRRRCVRDWADRSRHVAVGGGVETLSGPAEQKGACRWWSHRRHHCFHPTSPPSIRTFSWWHSSSCAVVIVYIYDEYNSV